MTETVWNVNILTILPEMFPGSLNYSITGRALKNNIWSLSIYDIRDYGLGNHKLVDDVTYGGGAGMLMRPDIIAETLDTIPEAKIVYMSPKGKIFNQNKAREFIQKSNLTILCGRFEGIDQRVIDEYEIEEVSIGDFILSGGELAAMSLLDSCVRLLPGIIDEQAIIEESFGDGLYCDLLEYPQYTKPVIWRDKEVPEVLLSGNHQKIKKWRLEQAEIVTKDRRPDLWNRYLKKNAKNTGNE